MTQRADRSAEGARGVEALWDRGQTQLAAGRYAAARRDLEAAERLAFRRRDAGALARLYLPLLEACRQLRQEAVEGPIGMGIPEAAGQAGWVKWTAGTWIFSGAGAREAARKMAAAAWEREAALEALVLLERRGAWRLVTAAAPAWPDGLPVQVVAAGSELIQPAAPAELIVPLPAEGVYLPGDPLHTVARESLLLAWQALALRWRDRHAAQEAQGEPWGRMAMLRAARRVDPACEPVLLALIQAAEEIGRGRSE